MFIENLINFIDKVYHQKRIVNFLYKEPIKTIVDVGSHKGEFIHYMLKIPSISVIYAFEPQKNIYKQTVNQPVDPKSLKLNLDFNEEL